MHVFSKRLLPLFCLLIGLVVSSPITVPAIIQRIQEDHSSSTTIEGVQEKQEEKNATSAVGLSSSSSSILALEESKSESSTSAIIRTDIEMADDTVRLASSQQTSKLYQVASITDGDTIKVNDGSKTIKVRLIGVDTPETVHPTKPQECYGQEASNFLKQKLTGQSVRLITDSSQDTYDYYNRLLAYVYLDDENINYALIRNGYGYENTFNNVAYKYQSEFLVAQAYAKTNSIGLWSPTTCNGQR